MKIVVGIIARNEEKGIGEALDSLFRQSLFQKYKVEVFCIANGCTDRTVEIARSYSCQVVELEEGNKINAWNVLIHEASPRDADYVILMDGDIVLDQNDTLARLVECLECRPRSLVAVDVPRKKKEKGVIGRFGQTFSNVAALSPAQITGQLYCARGAFIRRLWMPARGYFADDAFIKQMAITDILSQEPDLDRVKRVREVSHTFEGYGKIGDVVNHQIRERVARTTFVTLFNHLQNISEDSGSYIRRRNRENPDWFLELMRERAAGKAWVLFPGAAIASLLRLRPLPWKERLIYLPAAAARLCLDLPVAVAANYRLKRGDYLNTWKDKACESE